jgi:hypothetical protein
VVLITNLKCLKKKKIFGNLSINKHDDYKKNKQMVIEATAPAVYLILFILTRVS